MRPSTPQDSALGCNGILPPRWTVGRPAVLFDLASAPECTSDALASFVVQSCGSHFIYWGFQLQPIQAGGGLMAGEGVGGRLCLISQPQSLLLRKIKYDDQWTHLSAAD